MSGNCCVLFCSSQRPDAIPEGLAGLSGLLGHKWRVCRLETDRGRGPKGVSSPIRDDLDVTSGVKDRIPG